MSLAVHNGRCCRVLATQCNALCRVLHMACAVGTGCPDKKELTCVSTCNMGSTESMSRNDMRTRLIFPRTLANGWDQFPGNGCLSIYVTYTYAQHIHLGISFHDMPN